MTSALVELRVLEGPNLYFPRAAVKLTLDLTRLIDAPDRRGAALRLPGRAAHVPPRGGRVAASGSASRPGRSSGWPARSPRESGTTRLAVRVRSTADVHQVVLAYPWRNRNRAEALGRAVADVLDALPGPDLDELVGGAAAAVRATELGPGPTTLRPRVPVVAVTGTNGKTTTSRMVAHIARDARSARRLVQHRRDLRRRRARRGR